LWPGRAVSARPFAVVDGCGPRIASRGSTSSAVIAITPRLVTAGGTRSTSRTATIARPSRTARWAGGTRVVCGWSSAGISIAAWSRRPGSRRPRSTTLGSSAALTATSGIALTGPRRAAGIGLASGVGGWSTVGRHRYSSLGPYWSGRPKFQQGPKMQRTPRKGRSCLRNPAASYSPRGSTPKYHRRWQS
jgi:hypothetical protein